jgi:hypothetical protein
MVRIAPKSGASILSALLFASANVSAQQPSPNPFDTTGSVVVDGQPTAYLIRHLPVNAFPQLPSAVQNALTRQGCLIPQTYEAHGPENVVHASLERRGSSDWAVLCSAGGDVSLLVFFATNYADPITLASVPETEHLQSYGSSKVLGFNWAIDPASPQQVHDAQLGMRHPSPRLDHDALADTLVDRHTVYHFYLKSTWIVLEMQD